MLSINTPGSTNSMIAVPADRRDAAADHEAEDEDEQQRRNPRREERLDRHAHQRATIRGG